MSKIKHYIKEYWFFALCACIISSTFLFSFKICAVSGESMVPTLKDGEIMLMRTKIEDINRYDIIVLNNDKTTGNYIKRVIGLPGETIYMEDNTIYINGKPIEDVVSVDVNEYGLLENGVVLHKDEFFVLGDNRNNSYDSRNIGPIKLDDIKGKVTYSISNLKKVETKGEELS